MAKKYEKRFKNIQEVIERLKETFPEIEIPKPDRDDDWLVQERVSPVGKRRSVSVCFALNWSGVIPRFFLHFSSPIRKSDFNSLGELQSRAQSYRQGNQIVTEVLISEEALRGLKNLIDSQLEWFDHTTRLLGKSACYKEEVKFSVLPQQDKKE